MSKAKTVVLYLRVSTGEQTVENQRQELLAAAERRGWRVVAEFCDDIELMPHYGTAEAIEPRPLVPPIGAAHALVAKLGNHAPAPPFGCGQ